MKSIVISDLHLGIDDSIAETVKNRSLLIAFLENIISKKSADEVVINGDFLDQWFLPGMYDKCPEDSDEFRYYDFYQADSREDFDDFYQNIKGLSEYETGVSADYGDTFITLSTCAYHTPEGRFAVVAKRIE